MNSSAGPHTHRATYPKINVTVHFEDFLPANHEDLPVDSTARPHTHRCNRFSSYLFILNLSFRLTTNIYLPIILPIPPPPRPPPPPPPQQFTKHAHFNFSYQAKIARLPDNSSPDLRTHRPTRKLIYMFVLMVQWRVLTKIFVSNQLEVYPVHGCLFPQNYLFIFILSSRLTTNTYITIQLFLSMSTDNKNNIFHSSQREIKAVVRWHNEGHISQSF